ncbi:MAG TPA: hypothetical protein VN039_12845 [Nitrospira sp.]|nr:hypothetical protein [Nitrospira sp.]
MTTIPPITGIPVVNYPDFQAYTQITPFTVRDGATYLLTLESLKDWIRDVLVPHLDSQVEELAAAWQTNADDIITAFNSAVTSLTASVNDAIAQITDQVEQANAAVTAAQAAATAAAGSATEAEGWAGAAEAFQDTAMATLVNNVASELRAALDAIYPTIASVAATYQAKHTVVVTAAGDAAVNTTAANAALNTGADVILAALDGTPFTTNATLTFKSSVVGQKLSTAGTIITPTFHGDVVQITNAEQEAHVRIQAGSQPAGDYTEVAAIRIGSADGVWNAKNASVSRSVVLGAWQGNGVILEQGAHVDFTGFSVTLSVSVDGIRGTSNADDSNEAYLASTRISNAARYGYYLMNNATNPNNSSRSWEFINAKAFGCGTNFRIETSQNHGSIFSENGINPDTFTATSIANKIDYTATNASFVSVSDLGSGNEISGRNSDSLWDTIVKRVRSLLVHVPGFSGSQQFTQSASYTFTDSLTGSSQPMTVIHQHGTAGSVRTDQFDSQLSLPLTAGGNRAIIRNASLIQYTFVTADGPIAVGALTQIQIGSGFGAKSLAVCQLYGSAARDLDYRVWVHSAGSMYLRVKNDGTASVDPTGIVASVMVLNLV